MRDRVCARVPKTVCVCVRERERERKRKREREREVCLATKPFYAKG